MKVQDVMTPEPQCCMAEDSLQKAAQFMVYCDCGEIPVVGKERKPIGVITDRDITCRAVAQGRNPLEMTVSDVMSTPIVCVRLEDDLEECCRLMEQKQIRRVPVVDAHGVCCGIIALADIADKLAEQNSGQILRDVSQKTMHASNVA
jgi:CBS domain-containing protein